MSIIKKFRSSVHLGRVHRDAGGLKLIDHVIHRAGGHRPQQDEYDNAYQQHRGDQQQNALEGVPSHAVAPVGHHHQENQQGCDTQQYNDWDHQRPPPFAATL